MTATQAQRVCDDHGFTTRCEGAALVALVPASIRDSAGVRYVTEWETVPTSSPQALYDWLGY